MLRLEKSLHEYCNENFNSCLKRELSSLPGGSLPLYAGTTQGGMVDDSNISVTIIHSQADSNYIQVKIGVFFNEVIGGCSCGDDPLSENAYCELMVKINRQSAEAGFSAIKE